MVENKFADDDYRQYPFEDGPLPPARSDLPILDRSTLEAYGSDEACPFQATYLEQKQKASQLPAIVHAGEEGHQAIGRTIAEWIDCWADWKQGDVRDCLEQQVQLARPDVQPDAIAGLRPSLWELAKLIYSVRPENILGFDGGETHGKSGQLALDLCGVRITSELDLLCAGPGSPGLLYEYDWKTGWKGHTAASVKASFQFQMHAVLVFEKYPDCHTLEVQVWDTRRNARTAPVLLERRNEPEYRARISSAIGHRQGWLDGPQAWPSAEKCPSCPAAHVCPEADSLIASEPEQLLAQLLATEARAESITKALKGIVKSTGQPVLHGTAAFGPKPRVKAPDVGMYKVAAKEAEAAE